MSDKETFIREKTKELEERQKRLVAQGTPDESIPIQIAGLGQLWDDMRVGRKYSRAAGEPVKRSKKGASWSDQKRFNQ